MLPIIYADGVAEVTYLRNLKKRQAATDQQVVGQVQEIIAAVAAEGDVALDRLTLRFDGALPPQFALGPSELAAARAAADPALVEALEAAAANIRTYHQRQKRESYVDFQPHGAMLGQRITPLARVGLYVPGGTAAYPSSVLMNAIPAKIAGVGELVMVTPPGPDGRPNPAIMTAAAIAGVDQVYLVGGAQAVAALAYGTARIPAVDKIVGPGNIYVATAKKLLFGQVDIDMIAGPSEILVIADGTADPAYVAADLLSQCEHDVLAGALLLTDSATLAEAVDQEIIRQHQTLSRRDIICQSLANYGGAIVFDTIADAIDYTNQVAPEHLEIMTAAPLDLLGKIRNAGSIFLGAYTPEPVGDYYAGANHVLPTGGTARFFSALSVDSFTKKTAFTYYTKEALAMGRAHISTIAAAEGLSAHAQAIEVRFANADM